MHPTRLFIFLIALFFFFSCTKAGLDTASDAAGGASYSLAAGSGGSTGGSGNPGGTAGLMTAGEWNDLDNWSFWKNLLERDTLKTFPAVWSFYTQNRITIVIRDAAAKLVHNAKLTISSGLNTYSGVTDNFGKAELFAGLYTNSAMAVSYNLRADYKDQSFNLGTITPNGQVITKTLSTNKSASATLDIMFVVDATGSMGDEISYLKNELKDVIQRAGGQLSGTQIRMGSVFYRDLGDNYITRPFSFVTDVNLLTSFISNQSAGGGGDFPEAVDEGLQAAVNQQWSTNAVNRLLFLILDAPPHKTDVVSEKIKKTITEAQAKGIRIIPVSASGIDWETEFFLRFLAVSTNSTYVFITNHSGIGNPHHTPTVGQYQVEYLNNLLIRLIAKYGQNRD